jgi:hypothetical protein
MLRIVTARKQLHVPEGSRHVHIGCMVEQRQRGGKYLQMRTIGPGCTCKTDVVTYTADLRACRFSQHFLRAHDRIFIFMIFEN